MDILKVIMIIVLTPLAGGLLAGIDRKISARMQGRKGPTIIQPFYDVLKLLQKESIQVNRMHRFYVYISLFFIIFTVTVMLMGGDLLLTMLSLTVGSVFFVLGGYSSNSPYSIVGSERELLQMMSYEPMVLLTGAGFYLSDGSFFIKDIVNSHMPSILYLPGVFLGLVFILTIKLRKSPFDLSMGAHGAHQEVVKGITTEYSGTDLAVIEITHWYETIFALTIIFLFFSTSVPISKVIAFFVCLLVYLFEIMIDNSFARFKWQHAFKSSWIVTSILSTLNLIILSYFR